MQQRKRWLELGFGDQREILCGGADGVAAGVDCDCGRAKLPLSRVACRVADSRGSAGALPSQGELPSTGSLPPPRGQHSLAVLHCALHLTLSRIKPRSQNNLPCVHRSRHSRHCFQPPLTPPHQRFVFRVFRCVSDGFRLKTPLSNTWMRDLPGLKPRLRFLDRGATNGRAIRGHVIPRHSAFFRGQKKDTPTITFPCVPW